MPLSQREQAERTVGRVLDGFIQSGALPGPLIRSIQAKHAGRTGHIPSYEEVEREVREWTVRWLSEIDRGASPEQAAQD